MLFEVVAMTYALVTAEIANNPAKLASLFKQLQRQPEQAKNVGLIFSSNQPYLL